MGTRMTRIWRIKGDKIFAGLINLVKERLEENGTRVAGKLRMDGEKRERGWCGFGG